MHYVGHVDWSFADSPRPPARARRGLARLRIVGPDQGAVHTELAVGALHPGGWIAPHVHAFEEALYILEGELLLDLGGLVRRLVAGDYALMPTGLRHAPRQRPARPCGSFRSTPHAALDPDAGRQGHVLRARPGPRRDGRAATRPPFGDPTLRLVGHYDGTPPQLEALRVADPARGRAPAGMDTALSPTAGSR